MRTVRLVAVKVDAGAAFAWSPGVRRWVLGTSAWEEGRRKEYWRPFFGTESDRTALYRSITEDLPDDLTHIVCYVAIARSSGVPRRHVMAVGFTAAPPLAAFLPTFRPRRVMDVLPEVLDVWDDRFADKIDGLVAVQCVMDG